MDIFGNKLKAKIELFKEVSGYSIEKFIDAWNALTVRELELEHKERLVLLRENMFQDHLKLAEDRAEAKWEKECNHYAHTLAEQSRKDNNALMASLINQIPKGSDITINKQ